MTQRKVTNAEVARALHEMALFLEMEGVAFKPRAYEKAAQVVEGLGRSLAEIHASEGRDGIDALPAIGEGIAGRIAELLEHGRIRDLEELRAATPVDVLTLTSIEGLGPKTVKLLHEKLGVRTVADLERVLSAGKLRGLEHFGRKSEARLARGLELHRGTCGRRSLGEALPVARVIEARLRALAGVAAAYAAGSVRRRKETIGDLDFLVVSSEPRQVSEFFTSMPEVAHVHASGATKSRVALATGLDADLRVVPAESLGAALAYFTGSKDHNVRMRRMAQERGLKLSEYGLFRGERRLEADTEEEIYRALGLPWIAPEMREDRGEIEAAQAGTLPRPIDYGSLRGDLQIHTDRTDGAASLEEMVEAARARGLEYLAVTDHTRDLAMVHGNDERRLAEQARAVRALDRRSRGFRVLAGAEVNIREDGSLDIGDDTLATLDVVGVAIHSHFELDRPAQTRRVIRALENPHVHLLFHPTGRALGRRPPVDLDMEAVLDAARRTGTALEIDGFPDRLDLDDENVRRAVAAGVPLVIDSDAHHPAHLAYADDYGVAVARRGWARREDVLNTLPAAQMLARLKGGRRRKPAPDRR